MNISNSENKDIFLKFIFGLAFAVILGIISMAGANALNASGINIDLGGCKSNVFIPLIFGIPSGSILGFIIFEKYIRKDKKIKLLKVVLGFLLSAIFGFISSIALLDYIGGRAIFFILVMIVILALGGYQLPEMKLRRA